MDTKKVVTNETSNDVKREKVKVIPIMDEEMEASIGSIK